MDILDSKFDAIKSFIYSEGRLLERKLFQFYFENGAKEGCIKALEAYQNEDGGFGNGIEPDLSTPGSSAIGAETALYYLDLLDCPAVKIVPSLTNWLDNRIVDSGAIPHPPADIMEYPHQSWWENEDRERVLSVVGLLKKLGFNTDNIDKRISMLAASYPVPIKIEFYDYPVFIYAVYSKDSERRQEFINKLASDFERFLIENASHFPLFSRYWYHAIPFLSQEIVMGCVNDFLMSIQDDGGIINPYPQFPKWRPIFTLDGLILIKKLVEKNPLKL